MVNLIFKKFLLGSTRWQISHLSCWDFGRLKIKLSCQMDAQVVRAYPRVDIKSFSSAKWRNLTRGCSIFNGFYIRFYFLSRVISSRVANLRVPTHVRGYTHTRILYMKGGHPPLSTCICFSYAPYLCIDTYM